MSNVLEFDIPTLEKLILANGLRKTWLRILATHLYEMPKFRYILKDKEFRRIDLLKTDILQGLSIGEIGVLYEFSVALVDTDDRKSNGQFFTPDDVAKFMASFSNDFPEGIWLDPCCGIGNLTWHLVSQQENPERFLLDNVIMSDKDELALFIARVLFTVSFQNNDSKLFKSLERNFIVFDFLSASENHDNRLFKDDLSLSKVPKHDFVIVNPPYLATQEDLRFETGRCGDLYAYFLENIIKTSRGFISVTPQSFTNAKKFYELRRLLLSKFNNITLFTYDNVPANIFRGVKFGSKNSNRANSIRAAILVVQEGDGKRRITSLIRWRSEERTLLFKNSFKLLSDVPFSNEFFPKVSKPYKPLYLRSRKWATLENIVTKKETNYPLYIPSAPRYFIPALKTPAKRSSQKIIYFSTAEERDKAYLLINSSLMYWWWRVRDGGMTLSLETLMSLPMPEFKSSKKLVAALELSEVNNKVYKQNAGQAQENVKHPKSLLARLNEHIIPEFSSLLLSLHENSDLASLQGKKEKRK